MSMDDEGMRPVGDDPTSAGFNPSVQDQVRAALGQWGADLSREPHESVPEDTWARILAAVDSAQQAEELSAAVGQPVVSHRRRILPGSRWTTPLVAASVVGLALVVATAVVGNRSANDPAVVASDAGVESPDASSFEAAEALEVAASPSTAPRIVQAGFIPPARKVMDLSGELNSSELAQTVDAILEDAGVIEPTDVLEMPEEEWVAGSDGMTSDLQVLRDCVTKVTKVETSQALLVLRANVNGADAGLIVVPEFMVDMNEMAGMDTEKMRRMGRQVAMTTIYVVEPTCGMGSPDHDPTVMKVSFTLAP